MTNAESLCHATHLAGLRRLLGLSHLSLLLHESFNSVVPASHGSNTVAHPARSRSLDCIALVISKKVPSPLSTSVSPICGSYRPSVSPNCLACLHVIVLAAVGDPRPSDRHAYLQYAHHVFVHDITGRMGASPANGLIFRIPRIAPAAFTMHWCLYVPWV